MSKPDFSDEYLKFTSKNLKKIPSNNPFFLHYKNVAIPNDRTFNVAVFFVCRIHEYAYGIISQY